MSYHAIDEHNDHNEEAINENHNAKSSPFHKVKYFIIASVSIPILFYLFIVLPTIGPEKIPLPKLIKYDTLQPTLVPISSSSLNNNNNNNNNDTTKRLILIGDIHGSFVPLQKLLRKSNYTKHEDTVILLGDYLSKGPDSLKVLDFAISQNFKGVLGNHELSILAKYKNGHDRDDDDDDDKSLKFNDDDFVNMTIFGNRKLNGKFDKELYISRKLTPKHINYITSMPLVLNIGPVPLQNNKAGKYLDIPINGIASHLGINPKRLMNEQIVDELLNIDKNWYKHYKKYEKTVDFKNRNVVYYGHHASIGLNLKKYTKGLDSGCVYGGKLSAMIIWVEEIETMGKNDVVYKQELITVDCN